MHITWTCLHADVQAVHKERAKHCGVKITPSSHACVHVVGVQADLGDWSQAACLYFFGLQQCGV